MKKFARGPVRIILDTDLGSDCDDAGAVAVLHALADLGEAEVLACIYSSEKNIYGPGTLSAINHYYHRGEVPIGASLDTEVGDPRNDFLEPIGGNPARYGHDKVTCHDVPDLVTVYRKALSAAPNQSVRIVAIGHTKGLHSLLHSGPCADSPLAGLDLVREKVAELVIMGGQFPEESKAGWNFGRNGAHRYSQNVIQEWPTRIVFSGYEVGIGISTGPCLQGTPERNPVREAYRLWENALVNGRSSWDQAAVLFAVRGESDYWTLKQGMCRVDGEGRTSWTDDAIGNHYYMVLNCEKSTLEQVISGLMAQLPTERG